MWAACAIPAAWGQVIGIDIDPVNVAWCRDNMPWIEAHHVSTSPPTLLDQASVELVVGVSVRLRRADSR